ncbi:uncharacterized protein TNIN_411171 [Trichonephila inaurata madagascariensis]|uniref:Uncharacterized protein n=1 Tax=Trichonephila inaurata madagascariensis TaxID=2747483 RepID=A0A8X6I4D5_9ARAC|nr:uncharacterized protein TNIN_411171 [Trichonephila inaurata madagascariensis]
MSTDAKPMHSKCLEGKLSWCFCNRAKADNKVPGSYKSVKTKLSEVVAKILPVYQRLAAKEIHLRFFFLAKPKIQMKVNRVVWEEMPKDVFVSKRRIDLEVTAAVSVL